MKLLLLLIFSIFLLNNGYSQCLNGMYIIGSDPGDDYPTLDSAVNHLVTQGMCSTVDLKIRSGVYNNTRVVIPEIIGNNSANQLVIESLSGNTSSTILSRGTSYAASDNYTISIEGVNYLTLKNLTIQRASLNNNYATTISISDTLNFLVFENLVISTPYYAYSNYDRHLVKSGASIDTFQIDGSSFIGGQTGIVSWPGNFANFIVNDCSFSYQYNYSISAGNTSYVNISRSDFNLQSNASSSNILSLNGESIHISKNTFLHKDTGGSLAIIANGQTGVQSSLEFSNNFIRGNSGSPYQMKGAKFQNFDEARCYFNTIKTRGDNLVLTSNTSVDIQNNILDNQSNYKSLILQSNTSVISDYNCFNNGQQTPKIEVNGVLFTNFSDYQNISGFDNNSIVHSPNYVTDYYLADIVLNGSGTTIPTINEDLEGDLRGTPPDIGADEFTPPAIEAKLLSFENLQADMCPGMDTLFCKVVNMGLDTIDSIYFTFNVNGNLYSNSLWTGIINTLDTVSIPFADFDFVDLSSYQFELIIDSVNNQLDSNPNDNTLTYGNIDTRMQGVYTIGYQDGDFDYMIDALEELQARKTCGTVYFEFEDALHKFYPDIFTVTLPFELNGINEDSVIFRPQNPVIDGDYRAAIRLLDFKTYNCSKLFFQDLVFHETQFDFTWSDSIYFSNNYFKGDSTGYSYYVGTSEVIVEYSEDIFFHKNTFVHGTSSIDLQESERITIDSCTFKDVASQAIHAADSDSLFITNNLFDLNATTTDECIFLYSNGYFEILGNHFFVNNAPALGVYIIPYSWFPETPRLFANNSVTIENSFAIDWDGFHKLKMVHNNFSIIGSVPSPIIYFDGSYSNQDLYIEHNIFKNTTGGNFFDGYIPTGGYVEYNAYDTFNTNFHSSALSYSNWSAQGLDFYSTISDIDYVNQRDLHLQNYSVPLIGNDTIHVERDLDNRIRFSPPSIGAYELRIDSVEIELLTQGLPSGVCGESPIYDLYFTNTGVDTLTHGNFECIINNSDTVRVDWAGSIGNGDTSVVSFGALENVWEGANNVQLYFSGDPHQQQTNLVNDTINFNYSGTPMSGYYAVGGFSADFVNLQIAIDALNNRGVCDSVFLDIQEGTIPYSLDLTSLDATSIFLFSDIEGLENAHLWVGSSGSNPPEVALRIAIDSTENITFENLGLYTNIYANGVNWIAQNTTPYQNIAGYGGYRMKLSDCQNINIKSCIFQVGGADAIAILDNSHDITIDQNQFRSCGFAVRTLNLSDSVSGVTISNNYVENVPYFPSSGSLSTGSAIINSPQNSQIISLYYLPNIDDLIIRNNTNISGGVLSVYIENCESGDPGCKKYGLEISNNQFKGTCLLDEVHGTDSSRVKIFNNFFASVLTTLVNDNGLEVTGSYVDIFHNSIKGTSDPVYLTETGPAGYGTFRMEKNLFLNASTSYSLWPSNPSSVFEYSDNNAFAGTPPSAGNFETNSISYIPSIVSNYDFHITGGSPPSSLNQELTTLYDIDFDGRGVFTTYGADEFVGTSLDLATSFLHIVPTNCNDTVHVYGIISNEGTSVVNDYTLEFSWDNQPSNQVSYSSIGMGSQVIDTIYFGTYPVSVGNNYPVQLQITQVNSTTDDDTSNDELLTTYVHPNDYTEFSLELCYGDNLLIGNTAVTQSGFYIDSLTSSLGCDSLIQYNVTVKPPVYINANHNGTYLSSYLSSLHTYQWIDCQTGNAISGAINWNFIPAYTGDFAVVVTKDGCTDTSDCLTWDPFNGLLEIDNLGLTIYPNPNAGNFSIEFQKLYPHVSLRVVNSLGQLVLEMEVKDVNKMDVEIDGESGLYFVEVDTYDGVTRIPVVKSN